MVRSNPGEESRPSRGGAWVAGQFALIAAIFVVAALSPGWSNGDTIRWAVAGTLGAGALTLGVWSARALGPALTPFPRPREDVELVAAGPYRFVRHPIYTAVGLGAVALAVGTSPWALIPAGALLALFDLKATREERWLEALGPAYDTYRRRVRWRFLPFVR